MPKSSAGQVLPPEGRDKEAQRRVRRLLVDLVSLAILTLLFKSALVTAGAGDAGRCANTGVADAYQPYVNELSSALESAGSNSLGSGYESLPDMRTGYPDSNWVPGTVPCVILKTVAFVESSWHQADYFVPRGSSRLPLVSGDCGYGLMQITTGMVAPWPTPGALDATTQQRIAREYRYNISYGAKMLVGKWNYSPNWWPVVGNQNPTILEDWYFALWAYNGMVEKNWPGRYEPTRPPYEDGRDRRFYPYQDLVFGLVANPPWIDGVRAWEPQPITLPPDSWITWRPENIPDPSPTNSGTCASSPPPPTPTPTATPVPIVRVSTTKMAFLAEPGKTPGPQNLAVTGANSTPLNWSIPTVSGSWLSASPPSGGVPASVRITANTALLGGGWHTGSVTVKNGTYSGQPDIVIDVSLYIGTLKKLMFPMISR